MQILIKILINVHLLVNEMCEYHNARRNDKNLKNVFIGKVQINNLYTIHFTLLIILFYLTNSHLKYLGTSSKHTIET